MKYLKILTRCKHELCIVMCGLHQVPDLCIHDGEETGVLME